MGDNTLLRERIYRKIRDDITYGRILPGERLVESRVAEEFKASRAPIREALRQLESEGLTKFERNKGITVVKLSIMEVNEIYDIRLLLESYAARLSAEKALKKHVTYLRDLNKKLKVAARKSDLISWLRNTNSFHDFFSENCGNSNLHQILSSLKRRVYQYHYTIIRIPGHFETYIDQHEGILRALETNDGEMAERYMKLHIKTFKEVLVNWLMSLESLYKAKDFEGEFPQVEKVGLMG
jgi:DNA-binding GntR family transcriptional regulator